MTSGVNNFYVIRLKTAPLIISLEVKVSIGVDNFYSPISEIKHLKLAWEANVTSDVDA